MERYYKIENQAGERVGVAKAPRLGLQRTATPTAKGDLKNLIEVRRCGLIMDESIWGMGLELAKVSEIYRKREGLYDLWIIRSK